MECYEVRDITSYKWHIFAIYLIDVVAQKRFFWNKIINIFKVPKARNFAKVTYQLSTQTLSY